MTTFSTNLIKARKRLNLSQEKISESIGINQSTYQEWEKGRSPKIDYLPKLIAVLGLSSIDDLFKEMIVSPS